MPNPASTVIGQCREDGTSKIPGDVHFQSDGGKVRS